MELPKKGDYVLIHSYKHDGSIHRSWEKGLVLDSNEKRTIVMNQHTLVNESDGRIWYTREPAIFCFPHDDWFNVICMIRKNGVHYYCNIASPTLYDGQALKYIDYDLDLKVFPDEGYKILDVEEYKQHARKMGYSKELDEILHHRLDALIQMAINKESFFDENFAKEWYEIFLKERGISQWKK